MTRNPAQADMFAHNSQLGVKLKYVEDCIIDKNVKKLQFIHTVNSDGSKTAKIIKRQC